MYDKHFTTRNTPVSQPIPGEPMVKNTDGGGYVFEVNDITRLERFLILGTEGGTYYASEREITVENAQAAFRLFNDEEMGHLALGLVHGVSVSGRAHKNDPALFALAMATASKHVAVRQRAWTLLPLIARTGTHLFTFAQYRQAFGGWGPLARKGISTWYLSKAPEAVAFQTLKYQNRNGWSHRDLLRLSHAHAPEKDPLAARYNAIFSAITHPLPEEFDARGTKRWAYGVIGLIERGLLPEIFTGVVAAKTAKTADEVAQAVRKWGLHREMVPTEYLDSVEVQAALFEHMPMTAMIRNLGNLSKSGLLAPMSETAKEVVRRLGDETAIKKARVHPMTLLLAARTYGAGHGRRGKGEWTVVPQVKDALDGAIALSFNYVEPTNKRWMLGVDVSSSMGAPIGDTGVSACEAAALMALTIAKRESNYFIAGFASQFVELGITAKDTFLSATRKAYNANFGTTKIDEPMVFALKNKIPVDMFMVMTDNEVNRGGHPSQALRTYREKMGINAKLVVCAFTATNFTVADPKDAGMLDVAGLDANVPAVVADFATH